MLSNELEMKNEELFDRLVPESGAADTVAGELVRAVNRIVYRNWNDGDHIGVGYGNETCNPAARYIMDNFSDSILAVIVRGMWGLEDDDAYDKAVDLLVENEVSFLEDHPELMEKENGYDMLDFDEPEDRRWEEEHEEDDEDCGLSWGELRDRELAEYPPLSWKY